MGFFNKIVTALTGEGGGGEKEGYGSNWKKGGFVFRVLLTALTSAGMMLVALSPIKDSTLTDSDMINIDDRNKWEKFHMIAAVLAFGPMIFLGFVILFNAKQTLAPIRFLLFGGLVFAGLLIGHVVTFNGSFETGEYLACFVFGTIIITRFSEADFANLRKSLAGKDGMGNGLSKILIAPLFFLFGLIIAFLYFFMKISKDYNDLDGGPCATGPCKAASGVSLAMATATFAIVVWYVYKNKGFQETKAFRRIAPLLVGLVVSTSVPIPH